MENEDTEYPAKDHLSYLHTLYNALVQNNLFQVYQKIWSTFVNDRPVWLKTVQFESRPSTFARPSTWKFKHSPFYPMRPSALDLTLESYSLI